MKKLVLFFMLVSGISQAQGKPRCPGNGSIIFNGNKNAFVIDIPQAQLKKCSRTGRHI
ncbi:MAG: hypothetical protein IPN61_07905 [Bacteroidetes bacterium]|nr:hypothetical protein [Bacteroidota bacterium]